MRIKSQADLDRLTKTAKELTGGSGLSNWAARQISDALEKVSQPDPVGKPKPKGVSKKVTGESEGERAVRLVIGDAFGFWDKGGECVPELMPFKDRRYRCDFALPRCGFTSSDGWSHHAKFLADHHNDRIRGLLFSAHDWLPFRVSHAMAINDPGALIDSINQVMKKRTPLPRSAIQLERKDYKHGPCYRLLTDI